METLEFLKNKADNCFEKIEKLEQELKNCSPEEEKDISHQIEHILFEIRILKDYMEEIINDEDKIEKENDEELENDEYLEIDKLMDFNNPRMKDKFYRELLMNYLIEEELYEECKKLKEYELEFDRG